MKRVKKKTIFSIITVVLNGERYLEKTIKSVISQKEKFQYIIIDGGSTDNSVNIIKKYSKYIDYWISAKDKGLYYAFNKGLKKCRGEFIGIINSDDVYTKNAFSIIKRYFNSNPNADFVFGSVRKHWGILYGYRPEKFFTVGDFTQVIQQDFYKVKAAKKVGYYNTKYKYHADYDYFYRMIVKKN